MLIPRHVQPLPQVFNSSRAELYEVSDGQFTKLTDMKGQNSHMALHREVRGVVLISTLPGAWPCSVAFRSFTCLLMLILSALPPRPSRRVSTERCPRRRPPRASRG